MADKECWTVSHAMTNFDDLLEQVITTRQPVFIHGERHGAVLITLEEWKSIQDKISSRAPSEP
ncbi:hypothetical protein BI292_03350 [Pseudomonas sp. 43NM1]|uniref:type II toxin-antitoxin system Phd/YefM family antitoxin n=1 Tax=Pseudomonas sp. 43NM1 TaxID=1904755 RepID=UPI000C3379C2|nr:type II toxin-antitoxin system Phd/YefM family antitoxin [Pseudomonas sp. 43NM1]PKH20614.1 hypothetical protein BI292_03350 [Pseudomonas sp. 43NM1]